jgi:hypothetical protein
MCVIACPAWSDEPSIPYLAGKHYAIANWTEDNCSVTRQKMFIFEVMSRREKNPNEFLMGMSEGISAVIELSNRHGDKHVCREMIGFYGPNATGPWRGAVK